MSTIQVILIALFCYLGAIGSIVGNTIGWYCLGRPLVASFVVGVIMGDVQTAMVFLFRSHIWRTSLPAAQSHGISPTQPTSAPQWPLP